MLNGTPESSPLPYVSGLHSPHMCRILRSMLSMTSCHHSLCFPKDTQISPQRASRDILTLMPACRWVGGWTGAFALNAFIASYFLVFGVGFGIWAAIANLASNIHQYSVFAKCYQAS